MNKQDLNINPLFAAEQASLNLVCAKDRKKQQKELCRLGAVLKLLEKNFAKEKEKVAPQNSKDEKVVPIHSAKVAPNPSNTKFVNALADMMYALQMLQVAIAKFSDTKAKNDYIISESEVKLTQRQLKNLEHKLSEIAKKEKSKKSASFWTEIAEVFVTAVVDLVAVVTVQPEIAILATGMLIASTTGGLSKLTKLVAKGFTKLFEDMGMNPKEAEAVAGILAAVTITLVVMAAGFGLGSMGDALDSAIDDVSTDVEEETTVKDSILKRINIFNKLSKRANMAILAGAQALPQTGFAANVVELLIATHVVSKNDKQIADMIATILLEIVTLVASFGAGSAMISKMGSTAREVSGATRLGRIFNKLKEFSQGSKFFKAALAAQQIGIAGETTGTVVAGVYQIKQAMLEKEFAAINAFLIELNTAIQMNSDETTEDQRHTESMLEQKSGNRSNKNLFKGEAAFANIFINHSAV